MEKQFHRLLNDYRDNYIQYKTNGNERYKSAYQSAETAIDNLFNQPNILPDKSEDTSDLQMKLIHENDSAVSAEMRVPPVSFVPKYTYGTQYIIIGVLGCAIGVLVVKPWTFFQTY